MVPVGCLHSRCSTLSPPILLVLRAFHLPLPYSSLQVTHLPLMKILGFRLCLLETTYKPFTPSPYEKHQPMLSDRVCWHNLQTRLLCKIHVTLYILLSRLQRMLSSEYLRHKFRLSSIDYDSRLLPPNGVESVPSTREEVISSNPSSDHRLRYALTVLTT